ncbi:MAG: hypothetical protein ACK4L4_02750 [Gemmobacter sp.]
MVTKWLLLAAVLMQSGCAAAIYAESRKVTRAGIIQPLPSLVPNVATGDAADCVMKGLGQVELLNLPNTGTLDDGPRVRAFVAEVLARPSVAACVAGLPRTTA